MKKLVLLLALTIAGLSTTVQAQIIGVSTRAETERTFGVCVTNVSDSIKAYVYQNYLAYVAFDKDDICQAVVFVSNHKDAVITSVDREEFDKLCLPVGDFKWDSLPAKQPNVITKWIAWPPNIQTALVVTDCGRESNYKSRTYATLVGEMALEQHYKSRGY